MSPLFGNVYQTCCKSDFMSGMRGKNAYKSVLFVRTVTLCIVIAMKDDKDQRIHVTHWTDTGFCELYLSAKRTCKTSYALISNKITKILIEI